MMNLQVSLPPRPPFRDLPLDKSGPRGNAWGLFGKDDSLGLLNYITAEVTQKAVLEIKHGIRVCVDLPLNHFKVPSFGRAPFRHQISQLHDWAVNDDTVSFNPQSATQWDGFGHFGYQDRKRYFNGRVQTDVLNSTEVGVQGLLSLSNKRMESLPDYVLFVWHEAGGIATRGVLLDFRRWAGHHNLDKPCLEAINITAADIQAVVDWQKVEFREGDVLLIRTGYLEEYATLTEEEMLKRNAVQFAPSIGLEQTSAMMKFLWESGMVAVGGDMPTLEVWPWQNEEFWLHEWLLAGWGCPIGEYLALDALAKECERLGKWTFFFSSTPLNVRLASDVPKRSGLADDDTRFQEGLQLQSTAWPFFKAMYAGISGNSARKLHEPQFLMKAEYLYTSTITGTTSVEDMRIAKDVDRRLKQHENRSANTL